MVRFLEQFFGTVFFGNYRGNLDKHVVDPCKVNSRVFLNPFKLKHEIIAEYFVNFYFDPGSLSMSLSLSKKKDINTDVLIRNGIYTYRSNYG